MMNDEAQAELVRRLAQQAAAQIASADPNDTTDDTVPLAKMEQPRGVSRQTLRVITPREFLCVAPQTIIGEAFARMKQAEIDFMFVCGAEGKVVGSFSNKEALTQALQTEQLDLTQTVEGFMSDDVVTLSADALLSEAVEKFNSTGARAIALTDGERFSGAISDLDVITFLAETYPKATMNLPPVTHQMMDTREGE